VIFVDPASGECRDELRPPGASWYKVPGRGVILRRVEDGGWRAVHAFEPDVPLWLERGWERVQFRPAAAPIAIGRGRRTGERIALAPRSEGERETANGAVWVILPDQPGRDAPAARVGSQRAFSLERIRQGLPALSVTPLLTARLLATGVTLERALEVLAGPPVSPRDAVVLRDLRSVIAYAERLAADITDLAGRHSDDRLTPRSAPLPDRPHGDHRSGRASA